MYGSLLSGHREIGILLKGVNAGIRGSIIRDTLLSEDGGVVGRGIASTCDSLTQGEGFASGAHTSVLHIRECQVTDVTIAGVLYSEQDGSIAGSHISGAEFSVVMKVGSRVAITTDNQLSGSLQSKPSWQSMDPSPAPPPNLPFGQM